MSNAIESLLVLAIGREILCDLRVQFARRLQNERALHARFGAGP